VVDNKNMFIEKQKQLPKMALGAIGVISLSIIATVISATILDITIRTVFNLIIAGYFGFSNYRFLLLKS